MEKYHQHDCECCHYLGSEKKEKDLLDYYVCEQTGSMPTVIARFGVDGDYFSGLLFVKEPARKIIEQDPSKTLADAVLILRNNPSTDSPEIMEATARAIEQGFLDSDLKFIQPRKKLKI